MKKFLYITPLFIIVSFITCGCNTIDAINPVVQTNKMQNAAKKVTEETTQIKRYAEEMQKRQLEEINY